MVADRQVGRLAETLPPRSCSRPFHVVHERYSCPPPVIPGCLAVRQPVEESEPPLGRIVIPHGDGVRKCRADPLEMRREHATGIGCCALGLYGSSQRLQEPDRGNLKRSSAWTITSWEYPPGGA